MLAAKTSLAVRYDALADDVDTEMGIQNRAKLESRIRFFEEGGVCKQAKFPLNPCLHYSINLISLTVYTI